MEALETTLADHLDAGAALAVEQEPDGARVGQDLQARVVGDRPEERPVGGLAAPVARRELRELDAVRRGAVGVRVDREPGRPARLDDREVDRVGVVARGHVPRSADAVELRLATVVVLRPAQQRQHVGVGPAVVAEVGPVIEVAGPAADVEHPVHRARAAEHAAPRPLDLPPVQLGLGDRPQVVVLRPALELEDAVGVADRRVGVPRARLQQQHAHAGVDEPARDDGPGRAGPDHDDLRPGGRRHCRLAT